MTKMLGRGPLLEKFGGSKETHMMMELPRALEHLLHRLESLSLRSPPAVDADKKLESDPN
jgi:hypothetical protein